MVITLERPKRVRRLPAIISPKNIPKSLIYEMMDGIPIYRKGYKIVLAGKKTLEEILGRSSLQSLIAFMLPKSYFNSLTKTFISY